MFRLRLPFFPIWVKVSVYNSYHDPYEKSGYAYNRRKINPALQLWFYIIGISYFKNPRDTRFFFLGNTNISHYFWRKLQISPQRSQDSKNYTYPKSLNMIGSWRVEIIFFLGKFIKKCYEHEMKYQFQHSINRLCTCYNIFMVMEPLKSDSAWKLVYKHVHWPHINKICWFVFFLSIIPYILLIWKIFKF